MVLMVRSSPCVKMPATLRLCKYMFLQTSGNVNGCDFLFSYDKLYVNKKKV